jgi:hypothetical protein
VRTSVETHLGATADFRRGISQHAHQNPMRSAVVHEEVEVVRYAVAEVCARERRAAAEKAVHPALARPNELERGVWDHAAIEHGAH